MRPVRTAAPALGLLVLCSLGAAAQEVTQTAHTLRASEGLEPPPASVADVAWIAGSWAARALGGRAEEVWAPPRNGNMMGMFRLLGDEGVRFFEILTISEEDGSIFLRLKHFHPDLRGWEEKDEDQRFPLVELEEDAAFFSGLTFQRSGPDRLDVYVASESPGGETRELAFAYTRQAPTAPAPAAGASEGPDAGTSTRPPTVTPPIADGGKRTMNKLTPILLVTEIAPVLRFWEVLGFQRTMQFPEEGDPQFLILASNGVELMYQTLASVAENHPELGDLPLGGSVLYLEVEDLSAVETRIDDEAVLIPRRRMFYGAEEVTVREPGGHVVTFAQFDAE